MQEHKNNRLGRKPKSNKDTTTCVIARWNDKKRQTDKERKAQYREIERV
jgi:hypothetical protein